jgi:hypothetical protein
LLLYNDRGNQRRGSETRLQAVNITEKDVLAFDIYVLYLIQERATPCSIDINSLHTKGRAKQKEVEQSQNKNQTDYE